MALQQGTRLGAYEILSPLGAGGMGEVYRARDTKLQREVALKILPETMASDAQRMARFEREAQVLASLNHPNIAAIYGLEESNGVRALVMELVEGETLAERLGRAKPVTPYSSSKSSGSGGVGSGEGSPGSSLATDVALPIAKQIAEALEYAHERGVIHRDLKPANVKITPEGTVKVLDFGLAKVLETQDSTATMDMANSPTLSAMATQAGMIMGTAAYMSPEQAKGQRVDRRADIWAFGCVLFEMLTGRKPFEGETISDVLAAVIRAEPDWTAIPEAMPQTIKKLVYRCLQKDQRQRLQAIGEARITIEETIGGTVTLPPSFSPADADLKVGAPPGAHGSPIRRTLPWGLAAIFAVLAAVLIAYVALRPPATQSRSVISFIPPPPHTTFRNFGFSAGPVVVSTDGKQLAFSAADEKGVTKLWVRPLDANAANTVPGTEGAAAPFWSPDGGSLGFYADGKLKTVNLANGNIQVLADASQGACRVGGAWSPGGNILFTPLGCQGPLNEIPASGGKPRPVTKLASGEFGHGSPAFLPDGRHFLYESNPGFLGSESMWMGSPGSGEQKLILKGATYPQFASGHLLFLRGGRVFAQPFDPATGELAGEATAIAEAQAYSVSANGVLAYQGGSQQGRLEWFDRTGISLGSVGPVAKYLAVRVSPGGKQILAEVLDTQTNSTDLWSYPAAGGVGTRLTYGPGSKGFSVWSPDGKYVAYSCQSDGKLGICRERADGSGEVKQLITFGAGVRTRVTDWSPDGRYISFDKYLPRESRHEVWMLPLSNQRKPFRQSAINAYQYGGSFSPDGRWLAYLSYETGRPEVYVAPYPGPGGKFQISQNGAWFYRWDKKGHLYFLTMGNGLMEADLESSGNSVRVKALHPLFDLNLPSYAHPFMDVNPGGTRFIVATSIDLNASRSIGLLLNWQSKLEGNE